MGQQRPEFPDLKPQSDDRYWRELAKDCVGVVSFLATIWILLLFATAL